MRNTIRTVLKLTTCAHIVRVNFRALEVCAECGAARPGGASSWVIPRNVTLLASDLRDELPTIQQELHQADACADEIAVALDLVASRMPAGRDRECLEAVTLSLYEYRAAFVDIASRFMPARLATAMNDFARRVGLRPHQPARSDLPPNMRTPGGRPS